MKYIFIDFPGGTHTHTHRGILPISRIRCRNITSEECDSDCPFCPLVVSGGGVSGAESGVRDDTSSVRKTKQTDYRSEQRERESRARLNAARCHFVWPLWELPLCMTQSMSACHWDSLELLLPSPPHPNSWQTSWLNSFWCLTTFQLTWPWPITLIIPEFSLARSHNLNWIWILQAPSVSAR